MALGMAERIVSLGLMSGTSMDGIDAALIQTDGEALVEELENESLVYEKPFHYALKAAEYAVRTSKGDLKKAEEQYEVLSQQYLREELKLSPQKVVGITESIERYFDGSFPTLTKVIEHSTDLHAQLVNQMVETYDVVPNVVGYHGQNLYHAPQEGLTLQVGDPQRLADLTSLPAVSDFRQNDVQAGGQGAPFAPLYHQALALRDDRVPTALVNCGGIANVTLIFGPANNQVMGFDTGPGNGLVDLYIKQKTQGRETFDQDGKYGKQGRVDQVALQALFDSFQVYLDKKPPKSLDIGDFALVPELQNLSMADAARTLEAFTAQCLLEGLDSIPQDKLPTTWILAGGGWNNPVIYEEFKSRLQKKILKAKVLHAHEAGLNAQALEAQIFAYLAVRSLKGLPLSTPLTTGVPQPLSGGTLTHPRDPSQIV